MADKPAFKIRVTWDAKRISCTQLSISWPMIGLIAVCTGVLTWLGY